MALNDAVEDEIIESNPLSGWAYKNREEIKEEDDVDPFTREEQEALLRAARGRRGLSCSSRSGLVFVLAS